MSTRKDQAAQDVEASRFTSSRYDPAERPRRLVQRHLADDRHANPERRPHWFTTAFFHRPEQLADEIGAAGLLLTELVGVEGLAGWLPHSRGGAET